MEEEEYELPIDSFKAPSFKERLFRKHELPFFEGIGDYVRTRTPGDQFIFLLLGLLIFVTSLVGFLKLQSLIMITQPAHGGTLTEGDVGSPRFINPLLALSDTDQDLTALTYAGLMGIGPNNTVVPVLADSYIVSPDGKTYQFTLKKNLVFSDGSPLTADDVVYTIQKAQDPSLKSPQHGNWAGVQAIALDPHTVQFTLPVAYSQFIYATTIGILPAHVWRNITDENFPFSTLEMNPIGAGPFIATNSGHNSSGVITSYNLKANSKYVLGKPYLDNFSFKFFTDQTTLTTALTQGSIDSAYGIESKHFIKAPYSHVFAVFFNSSDPIFNNPSTRQALSVAIDRTNLTKKTLSGYATAISGPVPPGSGIDSSSTISPAQSSVVTQLLTAAKWKQDPTSNSWTSGSSTPLSITLTTSNVPELKVLAQAIQADWEQYGIHTTLKVYEPGDLTQSVIRPRAYQALLFGTVIGKGSDLYDFWSSKERSAPGLNITGYSNSKVDNLLSKYRTETDPGARASELTQINQLVAADFPAAFIESPDFLYSVPNDLKGVILSQITAPSDRFASVASWYRRTESVWPFLAKQGK